MIELDATVSVCIPIYNGARYLRPCLDSVLSQSRLPDEILIVDDGSTDDGPAIVEAYRSRDRRIRFVLNSRNLGLVGNWNRCIELAKGDWIKFVFQDDLLEPDCLAALMARALPGTDIVTCRRDFIFESPPTDETRAFYEASQRLIDDIFARRDAIDAETACDLALDRFGHNLLGEPSSVLLRKSCFERYGRFREGLVMSCDLEFWNRVLVHSGAAFVRETLAHFRVHAGATSADNLGRRAFRMSALDNLLLLRDFVREPVYGPLRDHAAKRRPAVDLEGWLETRMHEVQAMARSNSDGRFATELAAFCNDFPDLAVTPAAHWYWRLKRGLRRRLPSASTRASLVGRIGRARRRAEAWLERPRWMKRPGSLAGRNACLLVTWSASGSISDHVLRLARGWRAEGYAVVLVIASDRRTPVPWDPAWDAVFDGVAFRRNIGYDFGSWAAGLRAVPSLRDASMLALTNDSVYGPLRSFSDLLARVDASAADIVGLTDSHQHVHHLQSYLVFYRPRALASNAFGHFWRRRFIGNREATIDGAELPLLACMRDAGLTVDVLFPTEPSPTLNPTLARWRELIAAGHPFVKVQLLRSNPFNADIDDWSQVLSRNGFDPSHVVDHLGDQFAASAAGRARDAPGSPCLDVHRR